MSLASLAVAQESPPPISASTSHRISQALGSPTFYPPQPQPTPAPMFTEAPAPALSTVALAPVTPLAQAKPAEPTPDPSVVVLDPVAVTSPRNDDTTRALRQNDRDAGAEESYAHNTREGFLSNLLNSWSIPFLGGPFTSGRLAKGADQRAEMLALERVVILAIKNAKTDEERRALKSDLDLLRDTRRAIIIGR